MDGNGPSQIMNLDKKSRKRMRDVGRVRNHKQKKRLHILYDNELKAFKDWEDVPMPWTFMHCVKYIAWCHLGRMWPHSRYSSIRRYDKANLNYCTNEEVKERCIQAYQHIYNTSKVHRNEINLSILRMVYAEVILGVIVDWSTMEIQTNSKMTMIPMQTLPRVRKFPGEALGKKTNDVDIPNERVVWSDTSSDGSDIGCDPMSRKEIESFFKSRWLDIAMLEAPTLVVENDNETNVVELDTIPSENVDVNSTILGDVPITEEAYMTLLERYEESLKTNERLVEEARQAREDLQNCKVELQEKEKELKEYAELVFTLKR